MAKIRAGIIGTGGMAGHHAHSYKNECRGVELAACMDILPERATAFAERFGVKHVFARVEDLLDACDAVSVVTPDSSHAALSLKALKAGKHLLCEKPLTVTFAEARAVARAAAAGSKRGQIHMIQFSYRKAAAFQRAMQLMQSGALGKLRHVHSYYLQSWLNCTAWGKWTSPGFLWRLQTAAGSGGVLADLGCHILDLTTAVAGEVKAARCTLSTFPKITPDGKVVTRYEGKKLDANDSANMELHFADGALGICHTSRWAMGHLNSLRLEVHGTEGALMFDLDKSYEEINTCIGKAARDKAEWTTEKLKPAPTPIQRFVKSIQTGRQDQPDILRGAEIQAIIDACLRSAASGKLEKVRGIGV